MVLKWFSRVLICFNRVFYKFWGFCFWNDVFVISGLTKSPVRDSCFTFFCVSQANPSQGTTSVFD